MSWTIFYERRMKKPFYARTCEPNQSESIDGTSQDLVCFVANIGY
jgi:hypothetical protein